MTSTAAKAAAIGIGSLRLIVNSFVTPRTPRRAPLVTVIIATYNWSSVLRHAIRSVREQAYSTWELLVIGDGCTDDSEQVVRSFGDPRISWTNLPENSGSQSAPNNAGLAVARGEYVAYLGHDDLWLPDHLTRLVAALDRTRAGIASTVVETIGPPGSNVRRIPLHGRFAERSRPSSVMHRLDLVDRAGTWRDYHELTIAPDSELIGRFAAAGGSTLVPALTVLKFNSALRPNSYLERRDDEQREYAARLARERAFVVREVGIYLWLRATRRPETVPKLPEPPAVVPPGWWVTEWRRVRGLEPPLEES